MRSFLASCIQLGVALIHRSFGCTRSLRDFLCAVEQLEQTDLEGEKAKIDAEVAALRAELGM